MLQTAMQLLLKLNNPVVKYTLSFTTNKKGDLSYFIKNIVKEQIVGKHTLATTKDYYRMIQQLWYCKYCEMSVVLSKLGYTLQNLPDSEGIEVLQGETTVFKKTFGDEDLVEATELLLEDIRKEVRLENIEINSSLLWGEEKDSNITIDKEPELGRAEIIEELMNVKLFVETTLDKTIHKLYPETSKKEIKNKN